jgi:hypothetical protein
MRRLRLSIRTIGIKRAEAKITLASRTFSATVPQ